MFLSRLLTHDDSLPFLKIGTFAPQLPEPYMLNLNPKSKL